MPQKKMKAFNFGKYQIGLIFYLLLNIFNIYHVIQYSIIQCKIIIVKIIKKVKKYPKLNSEITLKKLF